MKYEVEIKEQNVNEANLFFGHFLKILHSNFPGIWREAEDNHHCFLHFTCLGKWAVYTFPSIFIVISTSTFPCVDSYDD